MGRRFRRRAIRLTLLLLALGLIAFAWKTKLEAHRMVTNPRLTRKMPTITPADRLMAFEEEQVTTSDGLHLAGWLIPGMERATVMLVHGYKDHRGSMLGVAAVLHSHGYTVLVSSLRTHDVNDGELISFGLNETKDLEAWYQFLHTRADVDQDRIGLFGVSMGGSISIRYTAQNEKIRALVADSAFSSIADTTAASVKFFTGLPAFPFAPAIVFWAKHEIGEDPDRLDATIAIRKIAPRPVFLLQGGSDVVVSVGSGQKLYDAAGDPKEFWFEPTVGHAQFLKMMPEQFETRMTRFFDRYLRSP